MWPEPNLAALREEAGLHFGFIVQRLVKRSKPMTGPFYVWQVDQVNGKDVETRYPQQFVTKEDAKQFVANKKALRTFRDTEFRIGQESVSGKDANVNDDSDVESSKD